MVVGMATVDAINPGAILAQMREAMDSYYSLGYTPDHRHSGTIHKVEVKVIGDPTASDASPLRPDVMEAVSVQLSSG